MVFPVVMYSCESWTIKKAEHRRTNAFKLWCWRRLLRVPWTTRRSNSSILTIIKWLIIERTDAEAPIFWSADSMEKTLMVETIECRSRREDQRMRWLYGISGSMDMNVGKFQELVRYREDWLVAVHEVVKNRTQLGDWTAITILYLYICFPGGSLAKNLPANAGDIGLIPELGRSPGEGNDSPLQYSCMPNLMDRRAWRATVDVVAKDSDTV